MQRNGSMLGALTLAISYLSKERWRGQSSENWQMIVPARVSQV
jgi:hypothetical protein